MKHHYRCLIIGVLFVLLPAMGWTYQGPGGLMQNTLYRCELTDDGWLTYPATGTVDMWNTRVKLQIRVAPEHLTCQDSDGDWKIKKLDLYVGNDPVPLKPNMMNPFSTSSPLTSLTRKILLPACKPRPPRCLMIHIAWRRFPFLHSPK